MNINFRNFAVCGLIFYFIQSTEKHPMKKLSCYRNEEKEEREREGKEEEEQQKTQSQQAENYSQPSCLLISEVGVQLPGGIISFKK